jgi:hypothetical protein
MTFSVVGIDTITNKPVTISQALRRQGLYMIGANGTGKTGLILNLVIQDIEQGLGVCVLDPHGDLTHDILARLPSTRMVDGVKRQTEDDVILLDLADAANFPFGLNLFTCPDISDPLMVQYTVDRVMHVFEKLYGVTRETPLIMEYLRNCTFTIVYNQGYTMAEIPLLLMDEQFRRRLVDGVRDTDVTLFWKQYASMRPSDQIEQAAPILRRVREFLQPLSRPIVGQVNTTINLRTIMDERKILLVKLDNQLEAVTSLIGSVIVALILNAAYSRVDTPVQKRKQFNVYADEFQRFATPDFATLLTEARKFGIATTIAHQIRDQLDPEDKNRGASLNVASLIVLKISGADAQELAAEFDCSPPPPQVIGREPLLVPKQDIVKHLLEHGHIDQRHVPFVRYYLRPVMGMIQEEKTTRLDVHGEKILLTNWRPSGGDIAGDIINGIIWKTTSTAPYLPSPIPTLGSLLYDVMSVQNSHLVIPQRVLVGFANCGIGYYDVYRRLTPQEIQIICSPNPTFKQYIGAIAQRFLVWDSQRQEFNQMVNFIQCLRDVMDVLAAKPVLVDSGQYQPKYGPPRTYADVQNEIATNLANLPRFTARVKCEDGEFVVKTLAPSQGLYGKALDERIERIRARTRRNYCRPRREVEQEIADRQKQGSLQPTTKRVHTV